MPSFTRNNTGSELVIAVLKTLGQPYPQSGVIAGSTNSKIVQIWHFATEVGKELVAEHDWSFLREEWSFTLDGSTTYDLPEDFNGFIGMSGWNRSSDHRVQGGVSERRWQSLKAGTVTDTLNLMYRLRDGQIEFLEDPGEGDLVLPYWSLGWARDATEATTARRDNLETDDDIVLYSPELFKAALKLKWLAENKFDTARAETEYRNRLDRAKARDAVGEDLSISPVSGPQFLSSANIPETGYGSSS